MSASDHQRDLGIRFEAENEKADLERWRRATDAERGDVIVELIEYAEQVASATGIRNDEPARTLPVSTDRASGGDAG